MAEGFPLHFPFIAILYEEPVGLAGRRAISEHHAPALIENMIAMTYDVHECKSYRC